MSKGASDHGTSAGYRNHHRRDSYGKSGLPLCTLCRNWKKQDNASRHKQRQEEIISQRLTEETDFADKVRATGFST